MKTKLLNILATTTVLLASPGFSDTVDKDALIARAKSAAPAAISDHAMIMSGDEMLQEGTNGWVCMPSTLPDDKIPMCNDATWMALLGAYMNKEPFKTDRVGISYMFGGDIPTNNDDPFDTTQDPGETWVTEGPHIMVIVPDTSALDGMTTDPNAGGPYVMWKGTSYAHIMIPVGKRP